MRPRTPPALVASPGPPRRAEEWRSLAPWLGFSGRDRRSDWSAAASATPAALADRLKAMAAADETVLTLLDQRFVAAWRLLPMAERPRLAVLLPNVRGMIREATDHGMIGAGVRRLVRTGPVGLLRLGLAHLHDAPRVLRRDFPTLLAILVDLELGEACALGAECVVLQPQMTDLALAMDRPALLDDFLRRAERRGRQALVATNNAAALRLAAERAAAAAGGAPAWGTAWLDLPALAAAGAEGSRRTGQGPWSPPAGAGAPAAGSPNTPSRIA